MVCVCVEIFSSARLNYVPNQCVRVNDVVILYCCDVGYDLKIMKRKD